MTQLVRPPLTMTTRIRVLATRVPAQVTAYTVGKAAGAGQLLMPLTLMWETRMKFLHHGIYSSPDLVVTLIWGVSQHMDDLSLSLSLHLLDR